MDQLAELLTRLRENKRLNKSQAADKLGISSQLLGQYERGQKSPKGPFFIKWKATFGEDLLKLVETNVSRETTPEGVETIHEPADSNLHSLIESNKVLSEANKTLADAHIILARGNERLIRMLELSLSSGKSAVRSEVPEEENVNQGNHYESLVPDKTKTAGRQAGSGHSAG